jgi:hypothetical protein
MPSITIGCSGLGGIDGGVEPVRATLLLERCDLIVEHLLPVASVTKVVSQDAHQ